MPEKRSLFDRIFGRTPAPQQVNSMRLLNQFTPTFTTIIDAYDSDVVRSAIDAIARNAAKLRPRHIRRIGGQIQHTNSNIEYLLATRPNPYMDAYNFWYKIFTQKYAQNNAFIYVDWGDNGQINAFYPVNPSQAEFVESGPNLYLKFMFLGGQQVTLPYEDIIHLRRFFYKNDLYGENGNRAIMPTLELIHTTNEGIVNAVKSSATLRGLLKFTGMLKPEDMKKQRDLFVADYLDITNNGGVAATDSKAEYVPLSNDPKMINAEQMRMIEDKVYKYYNVNEAIVKSEYTEEQWNAFYESVLEPLAIELSLEITAKLFTKTEQTRGNEIIFEANRLQYASNKTKISLVEVLMDRGILSKNQAREIFNMAPIEGGDEYIVSLNFINANIADQYQLSKNTTKNTRNGGAANEPATDTSSGPRISADTGVRTQTDGDS